MPLADTGTAQVLPSLNHIQEFGKLTNDDLLQINGQREELIGKLQKHYGQSKEEAERNLEEFMQGFAFDSSPSSRLQ